MCFEHGDVFPPSAVLSVGHTTLSVEIWGDNLVRSTGVDKRRSSFSQDDEGKRISEVRFLQMVILRGAEVKESVTMQNRRCSHIGTESKQFRNLQGFNNTPSTDPWRCHQRTGPDTDQQPGTTGPSSTDGLNRSKHREEADTRVEGEQLQNGAQSRTTRGSTTLAQQCNLRYPGPCPISSTDALKQLQWRSCILAF